MNKLIVVQARVGSSRLPGKVLLPLAGKPLLARMVERVLAANTDYDVVVATSTDPRDDEIVSICRTEGFPWFRGHATDLLDRHYRAAIERKADVVAKIPSDCPLIDPSVVRRVLESFEARWSPYDYVSNLHPATWPDGNDVEVMTFEALEAAHREAEAPHEREHTTPYLWDRPERFWVGNVRWETGMDYSMTHRLTIDYPEDYELIRRVYDALYDSSRPVFSLWQILELLSKRPDIFMINARYAGVNWYRHHLSDLRTIRPQQTRDVDAGVEDETFNGAA